MPPATAISLPLLDSIRIASPCSARWEDMTGDERSRHCAQCDLRVHNISGMTRLEAEAFLASTLGTNSPTTTRVCARFYRRADGTILTGGADCPVGLAAVRAKARRAVARAAAAIGLTTLITWAAARESGTTSFAYSQPLASIATWLRGPTAPPTPVMMGKVAPMGRISSTLPVAPPPAPPAPPAPPPILTSTPGDAR